MSLTIRGSGFRVMLVSVHQQHLLKLFGVGVLGLRFRAYRVQGLLGHGAYTFRAYRCLSSSRVAMSLGFEVYAW